jgi:hypothetical protein
LCAVEESPQLIRGPLGNTRYRIVRGKLRFLAPALTFEKGKPFYALVISALAQFHGLLELFSRGLYIRFKSQPPHELADFLANHPNLIEREISRTIVEGGLTELLGKQKHLARIAGDTLKVDVNELSSVMVSDQRPSLDYFDRMAAGSLLILAWDITEAHHTHDPQWEFLRHCRNAAAHGGAFHFMHGEPRRRAEWRDVQVLTSLQGLQLFADPPIAGFMGPGDAFHLLADIEATLL